MWVKPVGQHPVYPDKSMIMKMKFLMAALIMGALSLSQLNANAQFVIKVRPVAPVVVRVGPPSPRHIWVDGEWVWRGGRYEYVQGYWAAPGYGRAWIPGHWKQTRRGWVWKQGHWRR